MITYISMVIIIGMIGFFDNDFYIDFMIYDIQDLNQSPVDKFSMLLQSTAPPTELSTGYLTSSYVMNIYVYRPKLGDFYKLFMCWVVGLDCFTATGLYILPRFPLLIYIQILVSAIHTINDNVNNRSFIQSIKQLLRRAGFEPATYGYLFYTSTFHRSTN